MNKKVKLKKNYSLFGEEVMFDNFSPRFSSIVVIVARTFQSDFPSLKTTTCWLPGKCSSAQKHLKKFIHSPPY